MKGQDGLEYSLRLMRRADIPQVVEIEREAFPTLWPPTPIRREMENRLVRYLVVVRERPAEDLAPLPPGQRPPRTFLGRLAQTVRGILFPDEMEPPPTPAFIAGFVGIWFMVDEAHITAIAVRGSHRGQGLGELLLIGAVELAMNRRCRVVTLETRVTNRTAQALYEKYGFRRAGIRKGYYKDNNEDGVIMTTDPIATTPYQELFQRLVAEFRGRRGEPLRTLT